MDNFTEFIENIRGVASWLPIITIRDIIEISLISIVIYQLIKWLRGTRAWMLFKGVVFLFALYFFAMIFELSTILWIFKNTISVGIISLLVVFQPELRKALEQLGRRNILSPLVIFEDQKVRFEKVTIDSIDELIIGVESMAKTKTGALLVIEQDIRLDEFVQTGIPVDAVISSQIVENIFEHNTPLHDGAVIIRDNRIVAATCFLPLSDNRSLSKELGTRHRAAVGISEVSDCIVIIVSEETGYISMALGGNLIRNVDGEYLKNKLIYVQKKVVNVKRLKLWKGRVKDDKKDNK